MLVKFMWHIKDKHRREAVRSCKSLILDAQDVTYHILANDTAEALQTDIAVYMGSVPQPGLIIRGEPSLVVQYPDDRVMCIAATITRYDGSVYPIIATNSQMRIMTEQGKVVETIGYQLR